MAHFIVEYADNGDQAARAQHRAAHIAYRVGLGEAMLLAGPLLDDAGTATGSLVLISAADKADAERIATADPLVVAGVLALVSVRAYRVAAIMGKRPE